MVIDAHTHINRYSWENGGGVGDFRKNNVDIIIGMTFDFIECPSAGNPDFWIKKNNELIEIAKESEGRMIPFCSVHPKDGNLAIKEIKRAVENGMKGIKLHPHQNNFTVCSEEIARISEIAGELKIPVFFHCCYQPLVTPAQIGIMAHEFPKTTFILGHTGWNNEWPMVKRIANRYDNIVMCISGLNFGATKEIIRTCDNERIVFGSDFPCGGAVTQAYEMQKIKELRLEPLTEEKIMFRNITRILGLGGNTVA